MKNYKSASLVAVACIGLVLVGYLLPFIPNIVQVQTGFHSLTPASNYTQQEFEVAVIYIGCSTCPASNARGLDTTIVSVKNRISHEAANFGFTTKFIGVSKDNAYQEEIKHLAKYGPFDEVSIGNGWSNTGILKYIHNDFRGPSNIPQLLVTVRRFDKTESATNVSYRGIVDERLVLRKVGNIEISELARSDSNILPPLALNTDVVFNPETN